MVRTFFSRDRELKCMKRANPTYATTIMAMTKAIVFQPRTRAMIIARIEQIAPA
jgi:hypothetical protein